VKTILLTKTSLLSLSLLALFSPSFPLNTSYDVRRGRSGNLLNDVWREFDSFHCTEKSRNAINVTTLQ